MKPLYVVVTSQVFEDYKNGKEWEIRRLRERFVPIAMVRGRDATIRKGYSGPMLQRKLTGEYIVGTLEHIFGMVPVKTTEPRAKSIDDAIRQNKEIMPAAKEYLAFRMV
jgi:hypothetical protein